VANRGNGIAPSTISAYSINASTGALTAVAGSPFGAGIQPFSVTVDPSGMFAYVANLGSGTISAYTINASTGALTQVLCGVLPICNGDNFKSGARPFFVTVDPSGKFAYVANYGSGDVSAYTIDATGALTAVTGSPFGAGAAPYSVSVDLSGKFAYVANQLSNDVSAYSINASTGALAAVGGSPFGAGAAPASVTTTGTIQ
jgi:6-phosphogluconolactonase